MRAASARMTAGKRRTSLVPSRTSWRLSRSRRSGAQGTLRRRARSDFLRSEEERAGGSSPCSAARDGERNTREGEGKGIYDYKLTLTGEGKRKGKNQLLDHFFPINWKLKKEFFYMVTIW